MQFHENCNDVINKAIPRNQIPYMTSQDMCTTSNDVTNKDIPRNEHELHGRSSQVNCYYGNNDLIVG